jgi:prolyl-tRNA synthetase
MRQSHLFTKTRREVPKDEVARNAQLLLRAGFISKEMAGVYNFLPLGLRVLNKIIEIIRKEMQALGAQEILMSALQRKELWEKTGRWDGQKVDSWFKTALRDGKELGLGFTHEEPITAMVEQFISSYQNVPLLVYQFQTKFRNEERAKSGLLRTREFVMKDLYSFSKNELEHIQYYERVKEAYKKIFEQLGIGEKTYLTFASGGSFSKFSHEFQTVCDAGEDTIYINKEKKVAINKEVFTDEVRKDLGFGDNFEEAKAVEVGNIFTLGTRFSDALKTRFRDQEGKEIAPFMGSYGIGPARVMGVIAELTSDEKGLVWPKAVAPFAVHLVELSQGNVEVVQEAQELYRQLNEAGVEVLYDDRDLRAGEKFADSELMGIPLRVVVSEKTLAQGSFECTQRSGKTSLLSTSQLLQTLTHE